MRQTNYTGRVKDHLILDEFEKAPETAFRMMFDSYHMSLCIYAVELTDSFEMAEDVVQDFFVYFWEKRIYRKIRENLRNYLYLSVRNGALATLRKQHLFSMEELSGIYYSIPEEVYCEEERTARQKKVMEALEKLPEGEMAVVQAVILENKKYKDAAEELNISINSLKTHLSRAMKKMRQQRVLLYLLY